MFDPVGRKIYCGCNRCFNTIRESVRVIGTTSGNTFYVCLQEWDIPFAVEKDIMKIAGVHSFHKTNNTIKRFVKLVFGHSTTLKKIVLVLQNYRRICNSVRRIIYD